VSARPPTLSVMLSIDALGAHHTPKKNPCTPAIVLLYSAPAFFSKGVSFRCCERCKLLTRDYPLLEFGQRHFSRKNITLRSLSSLLYCAESIREFTFKVPPRTRKKAAPGERIFAGCKRIYILHQCTRAACVRLAARAAECY
jgi:hypothetical protein